MKLFRRLVRKKSYLGVDIGTSSIKVTELENDGGKAKLVTYGLTDFDNNIPKSNDPRTLTQAAKVLKKVLTEAHTSSNRAVVAIPGFATFSSVIDMPNLSDQELENAVPIEAKQYIPAPLEEVVLAWTRVGQSKGKIRILLTAAPKELINKYLTVIKEVGLELTALETEAFALARSLVGKGESTSLILDLGSAATNIGIVSSGYLQLNRNIDTSGNELSKAIASALNVNFARAEIFKTQLSKKQADHLRTQIIQAIRPVVQVILSEVQRMAQIFQKRSNKEIDQIVLSGGSALLDGFPEFISRTLGVPTKVGDPWKNIITQPELKPALEEIGSKMAVTVGLAMREIVGKMPGVKK